jgi:hypothetical protein
VSLCVLATEVRDSETRAALRGELETFVRTNTCALKLVNQLLRSSRLLLMYVHGEFKLQQLFSAVWGMEMGQIACDSKARRPYLPNPNSPRYTSAVDSVAYLDQLQAQNAQLVSHSNLVTPAYAQLQAQNAQLQAQNAQLVSHSNLVTPAYTQLRGHDAPISISVAAPVDREVEIEALTARLRELGAA